jgi:hypothetical protein
MLDSSTIADEIKRLRAAANVWIRAGDALNDYLAKQFHPSPDSG